MGSFKKLLCPSDGSPLGARAVPYAAVLAQAALGNVTLLHALSSEDEAADAERALDALAERLRPQGLPVETHLRLGPPGEIIVETARSQQADLIVMSTHGRGGLGRWIYGSVADHVLRHTHVPVLLVPANCDHSWSIGERRGRVLVPLDGSPFSEEVLHPAFALARGLYGDVLLARVADPGAVYEWFGAEVEDARHFSASPVEAEQTNARAYLEAVAETMEAPDVTATIEVRGGAPVPALARLAAERDVDAVAMATHGRSGVGRLFLGSVATGLLQRVGLPILLVRPAALHATPAQLA